MLVCTVKLPGCTPTKKVFKDFDHMRIFLRSGFSVCLERIIKEDSPEASIAKTFGDTGVELYHSMKTRSRFAA